MGDRGTDRGGGQQMRIRRTGTTSRRRLTRRLLVVLVLALAMTTAGAAAALAAPGHLSGKRQGTVRETTASTTGRAATQQGRPSGKDGSSPVPLVFAGILLLAAAGPWMSHHPRSVYYR